MDEPRDRSARVFAPPLLNGKRPRVGPQLAQQSTAAPGENLPPDRRLHVPPGQGLRVAGLGYRQPLVANLVHHRVCEGMLARFLKCSRQAQHVVSRMAPAVWRFARHSSDLPSKTSVMTVADASKCTWETPCPVWRQRR